MHNNIHTLNRVSTIFCYKGTELREAMGKVECCSEDRPIDELRYGLIDMRYI